MQTAKIRWDVERAAAWFRKHTWGAAGEEKSPVALGVAEVAAAAQGEPDAGTDDEQEEIDIAGWPALVAPFYD
jgi:hypothetical protein